ncbi:hypothetical protein LIER_25019 [Lithospermum erythrorhizon]|uniref:Integrase catalytic domain-containing protein n=1 Tax=Lithospermum erythrorhizon TaxID=34254 RepID=A0AAV3R330_LITER
MIEEELLENYKLLYSKWIELIMIYTKAETEKGRLKKKIEKLLKTVEDPDEEIKGLNVQLQALSKGLKMMNSSTNILEEILVMEKNAGDITRIGYKKEKTSNQKGEPKFIAAGGNQQSSTCVTTQRIKIRPDRVKYCHYCKKKGHIAPYCYKLYGPKKRKYPSYKTMWVKKSHPVSYIVYTSLKATSQFSWYFNSGCSRHMIMKKVHLTQIQALKGDHVTFGDGGRGRIVGKGQLCVNGLPHLDDVLLVEGLTANLISISQSCDDGMKVFFNKDGCSINNSCDQIVMKGVRMMYEDYQHSRSKTMWVENVKLGNKPRVVIKKLQHMVTTRVLELMHELMTKSWEPNGADASITHEFSSPITPQQNGVVERKNRTIQKRAPVMLHAKNIPLKFWAEAINTACHIHNRISVRPGTNNTNYEIRRGRKSSVHYFHIFGSLCYILPNREPRQKFDVKSDEGIFLGYFKNSRSLRVFNKRTKVVMEFMNVKVLDQGLETCEDDAKVGTPVINRRTDNATEATTNELSDNNSCDSSHPIELAS